MRSLLLTLLLGFVLLPLKAKNIHGTIKNAHGEPIAYANVTLYTASDNIFLTGTVSSEDGSFYLDGFREGKNILKVSFLGYKEYQILIESRSEISVILEDNHIELSEVLISASLPSLKMTNEGIMVQVSGTAFEKLGTAEDVIKYTPGIVKKQDDYEVFGKGVPLFYIDGKKVRDLSELDRISSENIKDIEVIYQPGAKYDASVSSVIRIQTKRAKGEGFGLNLRSSYYQSENVDVIEQADWHYRNKGIDLFGTYEYTLNNKHFPSITSSIIYSDTLWHQSLDQSMRSKDQNFHTITGLNYILNKKHSLGITYNLTFNPLSRSHGNIHSTVFADGMYYDGIQNNIVTTNNKRPAHLLEMYYNGEYGKLSIDFNTSYLFNRNNNNSTYTEYSTNSTDRFLHSNESVRNKLLASKLILQHPLFGGVMTVGGEYTQTTRSDDYFNPEGYVPSSQSELKEKNVAPFLEYSHKLRFGMFMAGLRYEHINFEYLENGIRNDLLSRKYNNLFPSISLNLHFADLSIQFGYTGKINRPTYKQLSNNVTYGNRLLLQSGNPLLRHEYVNNLFLSGMWKFLQFSLSYNKTRHAILFWVIPEEETSSVSRITYTNIPKLRSLVASLVASQKMGIWFTQLFVGVNRQWLTLDIAGKPVRFNTPIWQFSFDNTLSFNKGWSASTNVWMRTKGDMRNMNYTKKSGSIDVSITKMMLKDHLSIQIKGTDLLHKNKSAPTLNATHVIMAQDSWFNSRQLRITVRYKFNMERSKYKGIGAGKQERKRL